MLFVEGAICGFRLSILRNCHHTDARAHLVYMGIILFERTFFKRTFFFLKNCFYWTLNMFTSNVYCRRNVLMQFFKGTPFKCSQERRQPFCQMLFSCYSDSSLSRWELDYKGAWKMSLYKTYTTVMDMWCVKSFSSRAHTKENYKHSQWSGCPIKMLRWT